MLYLLVGVQLCHIQICRDPVIHQSFSWCITTGVNQWRFRAKVSGMELRHIIANGQPRSTILLLHGYAEHSGRYSRVIERFAAAGFDVFSYDQQGHGKSEGKRARVDVADLIADHRVARMMVGERKRTENLMLFGHSMGGLVTAASALIDPSGVDAVVLSGPAFRQFPETAHVVSRMGYRLARLLPGVPMVKLDAGLVSRDPLAVRKYERDPLNYHGRVPLLTGASMAVQGCRVLDHARLWDSKLPLLVMHGEDDGLANVDGSREFVASARLAGAPARLVTIPGAYHELLQELERDDLQDQMVEWMIDQLAESGPA